MRFAIQELGPLRTIAALPGCEDIDAELVNQLLAEAAKFASEGLNPLNRSGDRQPASPATACVHRIAARDGVRRDCTPWR